MSGRQSGKSTTEAKEAGDWAANNPNKEVLMIASVERQAFHLFGMTLDYLHRYYPRLIKKGKDRPTKSCVKLTNGSIIRCLPTGLDGHGIRGYTIDRLYADEAAFIPDDVWAAITPMLVMTGGHQRLLSTPFGSEGYFYRCAKSEDFKTFHITTEDVVKSRRICETWTETHKKEALAHLKRERERMTTLQYAQEYMGEFVSSLRQVFKDSLIKSAMVLNRRATISKGCRYYMGVDIARMGEDESTFEIIDRTDRKMLLHVENQITKKTLTTETTKRILALDRQYDCRQIFVDDGGMGVGVFDQLLTEEQTRRKVIAINNAARPLTRDEKKKKRAIKEDLYNNLLCLMERKQIKLLTDPEIFQSLKSVQFEIKDNKIKYFGNYTHIAEGLIRAAWCSTDKKLDVWVR